jgi:hypothetical protein
MGKHGEKMGKNGEKLGKTWKNWLFLEDFMRMSERNLGF